MEVIMSPKDHSRKSIVARLVAFSFLGLILVGSLMHDQETKSAEQPKTSPITLVAYQTSDQLLIDASLANPQKKKLQGAMHLELIRAARAESVRVQVLSAFEKDVSQT